MNMTCGSFFIGLIFVVILLVLIGMSWKYGWVCHLPDPEHWERCVR